MSLSLNCISTLLGRHHVVAMGASRSALERTAYMIDDERDRLQHHVRRNRAGHGRGWVVTAVARVQRWVTNGAERRGHGARKTCSTPVQQESDSAVCTRTPD